MWKKKGKDKKVRKERRESEVVEDRKKKDNEREK